MTRSLAEILSLAALLLVAGCLPHSCSRTESTALLPSDSLSREVAATVPGDTLQLLWEITAPDTLTFPRTVRFGSGDTLYVADAERSSLLTVAGGRLLSETRFDGIEAPYLAGVKRDTISLFSPATLTFYRMHDGRVVDSTTVEDPGRRETSLIYGAVGDAVYYKRVDPEDEGFIVTIPPDGEVVDTTWLPGAHWRYAGLMKMWGDTLASLSGFRPVVDLVVPGEDGERDTLALVGFDSPMLPRSRSFVRGDVHQAPLLSSSAATAGDRLFVLNMRAGWLQVDVFGRDGMLQHRLVQPETDYRSSFYPQDIDVRRSEVGYEIAVVYTEPEPAIRLFRWAR